IGRWPSWAQRSPPSQAQRSRGEGWPASRPRTWRTDANSSVSRKSRRSVSHPPLCHPVVAEGSAVGVCNETDPGKTGTSHRVLDHFGMRKIDGSAPRGVQGRRPWVAVWFQECDLPVLLSLEMAAKSFVLRRWPNFYFSRPHNLFRGEEFAGCQRASLRYATPVFLSRLMALANFMRLS